MNKIILMRHGQSKGNEKQIIQGKEDYSLSVNGVKELKQIDLQNITNIDNIYSSNLKRAIETAKIVKEKIKHKKKIKIDSVLREVSAGILDGKSKKYCAENLKKYYNIYLKRGDYNEIPKADNWQYSQARALTFLEKYIENDNQCDFVVSHAAFMRCMINTILYRNRNTKIELPNCKIYELENPTKNLKIHKYNIARVSEVYKISCYDNDYILKRKKGTITIKDINEKLITDYLEKFFPTPRIILMENREGYYIKIIKYLDGIHKFGELTELETILLTNQVYNVYSKLKKTNISSIKKKNILEDLEKIKRNLYDDYSKNILNDLLDDKEFINYIEKTPYSIVHNDLHRSNILFNNDNINIIDYESIAYAPSILQLASYISTCYLIEDNNIKYKQILDIWPEKYDEKYLEKFIAYRLLYGLSFFNKKIKEGNYDNIDIEIREKYKKGLKKIKNERNCN